MTGLAARILAGAPLLLLLAAWHLLYPRTEAALLAPGVAALLVFLASYRIAHARRRAIVAAALLPGASLRPLFAGRLGSALAAASIALLPLPAIAYFTLTAGAAAWLLIVLLSLLTATISQLLWRVAAPQLQAAFRPGLLTPLATLAGAAPLALLHAGFDYAWAPLPTWIDAADYPAMLSASLDDWPAGTSWAHELLVALRGVEVAGYWVLRLDGAHSLPLILFIVLRDTLVFFGLAAWLSSLQAQAGNAPPPRMGDDER